MQLPGMARARAELRELLATVDALELRPHDGHPSAVALGEAVYSISSGATQRAINRHLEQCISCQGAIAELMALVSLTLTKRIEVRAAMPVPVSLSQLYTASLN